MNQVTHPKTLKSPLHRRDDLRLDCLLNAKKVCDKCGFASTQSDDFEKHMREHISTPFYCFYCNHISYSKNELQAHLLQHTTKYPFTCQYCGHGYIRRAHLLNHVERLHSKDVSPELNKVEISLPSAGPVSSALSGAHRTVTSLPRPTIKVTIPPTVVNNNGTDKNRPRSKPLDTNILCVPNVGVELISPVNKPVQHNMALTVPLPEEVSIPAGCMVELIEVKTVNGTKELKLRLVSKQETKSVLEDTGSSALQHSTLVNPLTSTLNNQNLLKSGNILKSSVASEKHVSKNQNVERPTTVPNNDGKTVLNVVRGRMSGAKRTLKEALIDNGERPSAEPAKVPRMINYAPGQAIGGMKTQKDAFKPKADRPTGVSIKTAKEMTSASSQGGSAARQSGKTLQDIRTPVLLQTKIPSDLRVAVKEEPGEIGSKSSATQEIKEELLKPNNCLPGQPALGTEPPLHAFIGSATAYNRGSTLTFSDCKQENVAADPTLLMSNKRRRAGLTHHLSTNQTKVEACSSTTDSKSSVWPQSLTCKKPPVGDALEPEGFPVISSVFSLSQQPDDVQSSIRPLVKALRGIVMRQGSPSVRLSSDHTGATGADTLPKQGLLTPGNCTQVVTKDNPITQDGLQSQGCCGVVNKDADICCQQTQTQKYLYIKEETYSATAKRIKINTQRPIAKHEPISVQQEAINKAPSKESLVAQDSQGGQTPQPANNMEDGSSKFLTVSLERIHLNVWKPSKKSRKFSKTKNGAPIQSLWNKAFLYPAPLKVDQPVIRPGPNQPVVVLNHPKPAVPKRTDVNLCGCAEPDQNLPNCQILKMRLSKGMGQKYEVIGCTVGVFH